jgi:hypothetical protein
MAADIPTADNSYLFDGWMKEMEKRKEKRNESIIVCCCCAVIGLGIQQLMQQVQLEVTCWSDQIEALTIALQIAWVHQ